MNMESAFLKLAMFAFGAASALNAYAADPPAAAGHVTTPAALPGKGPVQHPFLCAGEWDTRKPLEQSMFIVRDGKVVWALSSWKDPDLGPSTSIQLLDEPGTPEDQER